MFQLSNRRWKTRQPTPYNSPMPNAPIPHQGSERYLINHPHEVERILRGVMTSKTPVTLFEPLGRDFIPSSIVALEPKAGFLLLEQGPDTAFNRRVMNKEQLICVTHMEQIHIQFACGEVHATHWGNEPVLRVQIPKELLRLQRREYFRLSTSVMNPVRCAIKTQESFIETVVVDISVGGMGVLAYEGSHLLKSGQTYHGCRIDLPGAGTFAISLNVRSTFDVELKNGRLTHRAGCQFIDLPPSVETEIQRFIIRVERERRARYT